MGRSWCWPRWTFRLVQADHSLSNQWLHHVGGQDIQAAVHAGHGQGNEECQDGYRVLRGISPSTQVTFVFTFIIINCSLIPYSISFFMIYECIKVLSPRFSAEYSDQGLETFWHISIIYSNLKLTYFGVYQCFLVPEYSNQGPEIFCRFLVLKNILTCKRYHCNGQFSLAKIWRN